MMDRCLLFLAVYVVSPLRIAAGAVLPMSKHIRRTSAAKKKSATLVRDTVHTRPPNTEHGAKRSWIALEDAANGPDVPLLPSPQITSSLYPKVAGIPWITVGLFARRTTTPRHNKIAAAAGSLSLDATKGDQLVAAAEDVRQRWAPEFLVALMGFSPGSVTIEITINEGPNQGRYKVVDWQPAYGDGGRGYFVCELMT